MLIRFIKPNDIFKYYNVTLVWRFKEKEVAKCGDGIISGNETCDLGGKEDGNIS